MQQTVAAAAARGAIPVDLPRGRSAADPAPHLPLLLTALRGGEEWKSAFGRFWFSLAGTAHPDWPPADGRVNWTWLTDLESADHAVDLGSAFGEIASALSAEFGRVTYLGRASAHGDVVAERFRPMAPAIDVQAETQSQRNEADVVVFLATQGWEDRLPSGISGADDIPAFAYRTLRPGGWFACLCPSGVSFASLRAGPRGVSAMLGDSLLRRSISSGIRRAGFAPARRYSLSPSHDLPFALVPLEAGALRAWTQLSKSGDWWHRLPGRLREFSFAGTLLLAQR